MWVEFTYDAYGMPQIHVPGAPDNTLAQAVQAAIGLMLTPQLYRGYVYAAVGEMYTYYLGSRYYVPQLCRFFNADKHSDTQTGVLATNMFAYCNNNPVTYIDPKGEAISMKTIINIITYLLNPFTLLAKSLSNTTYSYKKRINKECLDILKYYNCIHKNLITDTYYSCTITASNYNFYDDKTIINMKVTSQHVLGGRMYIIAQFDLRTIQEWFEYINQSIVEQIPIYREIAQWCEENEVLMYALGECATGTFADVLFVLDALDVFFEIYDEFFPSKKEKHVIAELKRLGYTYESDAYMIILDESYSYQSESKWWYTHNRIYNEYTFSPYA